MSQYTNFPVAEWALAGVAVDPDVVPEAGAVAERLGAHRASELALRVCQALLSKIISS